MKYEFTGWIEKVCDAGKYDREIIVRDKENTMEDYISFVTFTVKAKNDAEVENLAVDTKVKIEFFLNGIMGVSKATNKPYHINKLTLAKIEVLSTPSSSSTPTPAPVPNDEPFVEEPKEELPF